MMKNLAIWKKNFFLHSRLLFFRMNKNNLNLKKFWQTAEFLRIILIKLLIYITGKFQLSLLYLVLGQQIYLFGDRTNCILHTRKMSHFLNAKLSLPPPMNMVISTSSRSALKNNKCSLLPKRSYCSIPVTIRN